METHLEAEITLLPTEEGGRRVPIFQRYRPRLLFDGQFYQSQFIFSQRGVKPGQTVVVGINLMHPERLLGKLGAGSRFEFAEGEQVVGSGRVLRVL